MFYDDSSLITLSSTSLSLSCLSDLSDGSQTFTYYFGSTASNKKLLAASNPGVDNITLTPTDILPIWAASTAYTLGQSITPTTPNSYRYQCTTAGTSGGTEPGSWGVTLNGTTSDGSVVWTLVAAESPATEIKLSLTSLGLATATAGAALSLGNTVLSGVSNAIPIYIKITNTITVVSDSLTTPELGININNVIQQGV